MRKTTRFIALVAVLISYRVADAAFTFDDITFWAGSPTGANRAAMVVHWSAPEVFNLWDEQTPMPAPVTEKVMVWGYRFDGTANAEQMMLAIAQADPCLYLYGGGQPGLGVAVLGIGYDLDNDGDYGLSDGWTTYTKPDFTNGFLGDQTYSDADYFVPTDAGDLYWGGWYGANWELWHEHGKTGGFDTAPDRGEDLYWTGSFFDGSHGQWDFSGLGISSLEIKDGSWVGWSVSAGGLNMGDFENPGTLAWIEHKQAPDITLVPEPASLGLLIVGGVGLLARRRRHG